MRKNRYLFQLGRRYADLARFRQRQQIDGRIVFEADAHSVVDVVGLADKHKNGVVRIEFRQVMIAGNYGKCFRHLELTQ